MIIKPLFPFFCTPNLNPILNKPLNNKRCFVVSAANTVKHKYK